MQNILSTCSMRAPGGRYVRITQRAPHGGGGRGGPSYLIYRQDPPRPQRQWTRPAPAPTPEPEKKEEEKPIEYQVKERDDPKWQPDPVTQQALNTNKTQIDRVKMLGNYTTGQALRNEAIAGMIKRGSPEFDPTKYGSATEFDDDDYKELLNKGYDKREILDYGHKDSGLKLSSSMQEAWNNYFGDSNSIAEKFMDDYKKKLMTSYSYDSDS